MENGIIMITNGYVKSAISSVLGIETDSSIEMMLERRESAGSTQREIFDAGMFVLAEFFMKYMKNDIAEILAGLLDFDETKPNKVGEYEWKIHEAAGVRVVYAVTGSSWIPLVYEADNLDDKLVEYFRKKVMEIDYDI